MIRELTSLVEQYIQHNMDIEPIDGVFISEDLSISLVMEDDIYYWGDFYRMDVLITKEMRGEQEIVIPNHSAIKRIAAHYTSHS